jgi:hypothetical protein
MTINVSSKTVLAFLVGAAFAATAIFVWVAAAPSARAQEDEPTSDNLTGLNSKYILELNDNLKQAGERIVEPGTKAFYDKLISGYDLDQATNAGDEWLPDVDYIQRSAITLPLQEAGKQIKDADIADFYARFLADTGLGPKAAR